MGIFNNVTEITFALIGLALGVLFGLDGWRGTTGQDGSFLKQPRVRTLTWVLGSGFLGFLGSLVFEDVSRARLLFYYFLFFIVGSFLVVVGLGGLVFVTYAYTKLFHPDKYPSPPFSPALHYFFYGYTFVRQEYAKGLVILDEQISEKRQELLPA